MVKRAYRLVASVWRRFVLRSVVRRGVVPLLLLSHPPLLLVALLLLAVLCRRWKIPLRRWKVSLRLRWPVSVGAVENTLHVAAFGDSNVLEVVGSDPLKVCAGFKAFRDKLVSVLFELD